MIGLSYTIHELAHLMEAADLHQGVYEKTPLRHVSFDTRTISHGAETLFIALKTQNRDGHDFIPQALKKGVKNFIVDRPISAPAINYALVPDPLDALQRWARHHRQRFTYPVIGITGSNGKTTVKEWLTTLLEMDFRISKSPMSYNSQLGVALSLLQMKPQADFAIIEAGISQVGEMAVLEEMIQPTLGILTHMGLAHQEGFVSEVEKLAEKCLLFQRSKLVIAGAQFPWITDYLKAQSFKVNMIGSDLIEKKELFFPLTDQASKENTLLAIAAAIHLGMDAQRIGSRLHSLHPIEMRTEIISDNPEVTLINDSYNSDPDSVRNAFQFLHDTKAQPKRLLILTDIPHQGKGQSLVQQTLLAEAQQLFGAENIWTIGPIFKQLSPFQAFADTDAFIDAFDYQHFKNSTLLLKGARQFELERLLPLFNRRLNASYLQIDLDALSHNYRTLKAMAPPATKLICMVKAFSYGSGSWEIAQALELEGADYLAVAYSSEGIELREKGIRMPILVYNPDKTSMEALIRYQLEPLFYDTEGLFTYLQLARLLGYAAPRVHLKFDTGMGRLGFRAPDLPALFALILQSPDLEIVSLLSHLAAAGEATEDDFTTTQVTTFLGLCDQFEEAIGFRPLRHVLNTAGLIRHPHFSLEMIRLGIGLYGINPTQDSLAIPLREIGSLRSIISQIHDYPAGASIGYGRAQYLRRASRIATVPIGYADGAFRSLGEGAAQFLVQGRLAPTVGRVCMDMLMLDVTDIPAAHQGDEVVLFGGQKGAFLSAKTVAQQAGTIAYELLARISPRVRRIFVRE